MGPWLEGQGREARRPEREKNHGGRNDRYRSKPDGNDEDMRRCDMVGEQRSCEGAEDEVVTQIDQKIAQHAQGVWSNT